MSFRLKTIVGIASIQILLMVALVTSSLSFLSESNDAALEEQGRSTASSLAAVATEAAISSDLATLVSLAEDTVGPANILHVRIFDMDGNLLAQARSDNEATSSPDIHTTRAEITLDSYKLGEVEVGIDASSHAGTFKVARSWFIALATAEVLMTAVASSLLIAYLTRHLFNIRRAANKIEAGHVGYQIRNPGSDEIGTAAKAFNHMSRTLRVRTEELKAATIEANAARKRAETANIAKSQFLANMSHEIRTPLNAIIGFSHILKNAAMGPKEKNFVDKINTSGQALLEILNDILDLSKIEAEAMELEKIEFEPAALLEQVKSTVSYLASEKNLALELILPPNMPRTLLGDPVKIRQVLLNLVNNAVKFTETGGVTIEVKIESQEGRNLNLRICVKDTGIGIKEDRLEAIFTPFEQADGSSSRKYGGTGLGLAISKNLVNLMKGTIEVRNRPSGGTAFTFTVPLEETVSTPCILSGDIEGFFDAVKCYVFSPEDTLMDEIIEITDRTGAKIQRFQTLQELYHELDISGAISSDPDATASVKIFILDVSIMPPDDLLYLQKLSEAIAHRYDGLILLVDVHEHCFAEEELIHGHNVSFTYKNYSRETLLPCLTQLVDNLTSQHATETRPVWQVQEGPTKAPLKDVHILLVEDDRVNELVAQHILLQTGALVTIARTGKEALDYIFGRTNACDIVLMDLKMPEMDGLETCRLIREKISADQLPILAFTANTFQDDISNCMAAGMQAHIGKPISPSTLVQKIADWTIDRKEPAYHTDTPADEDLSSELKDLFSQLNERNLAAATSAREFIEKHPRIGEKLQKANFLSTIEHLDFGKAISILEKCQEQ